ncbi:hypothetical protein GGI15_001810 [Coemansia interrupta]|uniref:Uncharacterized protein n=1 Tax=Coemansia interrupta TaxID=1126814 RepID=A0A9W8HNW8_9FUNG|nr:hypothetical protein GGI15_001810 [Coemansia interrupta]
MSQGQQYPANNYSQYTTMNQPPYPPPQGYPNQHNSGGGMSHAPPMNQRISNAGHDSMYPPPLNQSGYAPPHPPMSEAGRPMSAYNPPPMRPQSQYTGRPQSQYNPNPSSQYYQHGKNKNGAHYGHLVTQEPDRDTACGGDACGACCKYNTLACLFCCNGWLRLCGRGMSIKDILSFK